MSACAVMIDCDFHLQLDAYHDRELDAEARRRFEQHLKNCPTCPGELAAMQALSARIETAIANDINSDELAGMHEAVRRTDDRESFSFPVRTAGLLSALAASVLIISGVWLLDLRGEGGGNKNAVAARPVLAPEWERVATTLRADPRIGIGDDLFFSPRYASTVDWMLRNLVPTERKPWVKPGSS